MRRFAVFIPTTAGPVRVERITRECAPQSMVCLKRTSTVLPISAGYDSFVRPGSGVIERTLGPFEDGAFRLDLSDAVDSGESWQLGVYVAHALCVGGAALASEDDADTIVWLTGHVDYDLAVGSVGHLAEKVHSSREAISSWLEQGRSVIILVSERRDHDEALASGIPTGARIVPIRTIADALDVLRFSPYGAAVPAISVIPARRSSEIVFSRTRFVSAFAIAGVAAFAFVQGAPQEFLGDTAAVFQREVPTAQTSIVDRLKSSESAPLSAQEIPATPAPEPEAPPASVPTVKAPVVTLYERRAPQGKTCAQVQFGTAEAEEVAIVTSESISADRITSGLCGLSIAVDNGSRRQFVALNLDVLSGKLLYGTVKPKTFNGQIAFAGTYKWAIDLPRRLQAPFEFRVTAVTGDSAVPEDSSTGVAVASIQHRVLP